MMSGIFLRDIFLIVAPLSVVTTNVFMVHVVAPKRFYNMGLG
jgi:hypothetical protein